MQKLGQSNKSNIEASIGFSRKWNSKEAGREVAKSAIKKLNTPPSFILLFSTTHYQNTGGFKEILDGIWEVIPKGTPLIGGTVSSFINNYGCCIQHYKFLNYDCDGKNTRNWYFKIHGCFI